MADDEEKAPERAGGQHPGPEAMLGMWAAWMDQMTAAAPAASQAGKLWQMPPAASAMMAGGARQIEDLLSKDPTLRSIAEMWNANPLHKVVPLDWAEIAGALRTVGMRSFARPATAKSVMELSQLVCPLKSGPP